MLKFANYLTSLVTVTVEREKKSEHTDSSHKNFLRKKYRSLSIAGTGSILAACRRRLSPGGPKTLLIAGPHGVPKLCGGKYDVNRPLRPYYTLDS